MTKRNHKRWIAGLLVAALAMATVAPAADAGSRKHRDKHSRYEKKVRKNKFKRAHRRHGRHVVEVHRRSDGLPALAFFGGLVLGAVLSNSHGDGADHYEEMPAYDYYDPYCERPFTTLKVYVKHFRHHRHPRVVHVMEADTGNHIHTYRYYRGDWVSWDDGW